MKPKQLLAILGAVLLIAGGILFLTQGRVFATFILDTMVVTIAGDAEMPPLPEFSWGVLDPNGSLPALRLSSIGLLLCLLGVVLSTPASAFPKHRAGGPSRLILVGLGLTLLVASFCSWFLAQRIISELIFLKEHAVPDPISFGDSMPVGVWAVGRAALCVALLLLASLTFFNKAHDEDQKPSTAMSLIRLSAMIALALSLMLLLVAAVGPATRVCQMAQTSHSIGMDPAELAEQISLAVRMVYLASGVMLLSVPLTLVSAFKK